MQRQATQQLNMREAPQARPKRHFLKSQPQIEDVRSRLVFDGYSPISLAEISSMSDISPDVLLAYRGELVDELSKAPFDEYCDPRNRIRRMHTTGYFRRRDDHVSFDTTGVYSQPASYNPELGGVTREFTPFPAHLIDADTLRLLVILSFYLLPWRRAEEVDFYLFNLHAIRMIATPGRPAKASPNLLHRDGEPFTACLHLGTSDAALGGESSIVDGETEDTRLHRSLREPYAGWIADDSAVFHSVQPLYCPSGVSSVHRDVLLIDFEPFDPKSL